MHLQLIRQQQQQLARTVAVVHLGCSGSGLAAVCHLLVAVSRFYGLPWATPTWQLIDIVYRFTSNKFHFQLHCVCHRVALRHLFFLFFWFYSNICHNLFNFVALFKLVLWVQQQPQLVSRGICRVMLSDLWSPWRISGQTDSRSHWVVKVVSN